MSLAVVVFGITGDLAKRKLIVSLWQLYESGRIDRTTAFWGCGRRDLSQDGFGQLISSGAPQSNREFQKKWRYVRGEIDDPATFEKLAINLQPHHHRLVYLSVGPQLVAPIADGLFASQTIARDPNHKVVVEKPFGTNVTSAKRLEQRLESLFAGGQIYRIDHYLGKHALRRLVVRAVPPMASRLELISTSANTAHSARDYLHSVGVVGDFVQNHSLETIATVLTWLRGDSPAAGARLDNLKSLKLVDWRRRPKTGAATMAELTFESRGTTVRIIADYDAVKTQSRLTLDDRIVELGDPVGELLPHALLLNEAISGETSWFVSPEEVFVCWRLVAPLLNGK